MVLCICSLFAKRKHHVQGQLKIFDWLFPKCPQTAFMNTAGYPREIIEPSHYFDKILVKMFALIVHTYACRRINSTSTVHSIILTTTQQRSYLLTLNPIDRRKKYHFPNTPYKTQQRQPDDRKSWPAPEEARPFQRQNPHTK